MPCIPPSLRFAYLKLICTGRSSNSLKKNLIASLQVTKNQLFELHEVLHRQGLLDGLWTLNPDEVLSPGQKEEIDRVYKAYPNLNDDDFIAENLDKWLS